MTEKQTVSLASLFAAERERDELRAENEHLRAILKWAEIYFEDSQRAEWTDAQRAQAVIGVRQQFAKIRKSRLWL
jgi:hypothetical protein